MDRVKDAFAMFWIAELCSVYNSSRGVLIREGDSELPGCSAFESSCLCKLSTDYTMEMTD
jgi:hypothetical protein